MTKLQSVIARLCGIKPPERPLAPILRDANTVRLSEWRAKESLVGASGQLATNKTYQLQMAVLQNEHPCHTVLALGVSPNDRLVHQARCEGYEMATNNLEAMCKPLKTQARLEATFAPPVDEPVARRR